MIHHDHLRGLDYSQLNEAQLAEIDFNYAAELHSDAWKKLDQAQAAVERASAKLMKAVARYNTSRGSQ